VRENGLRKEAEEGKGCENGEESGPTSRRDKKENSIDSRRKGSRDIQMGRSVAARGGRLDYGKDLNLTGRHGDSTGKLECWGFQG